MEEQIQKVRDWLGQGSINIFGMPYAGKDTQGGELADLLGAELMGGGQILRGSVIPDRVRQIMESGDLIPTEDYLQIVLPYLSHERFAGKPLVLSSVGRWDGEQAGVMQAAELSGHPIKAVVLLNVGRETAYERHKTTAAADRGHRVDDAPEVFEARLNEFSTKTSPVIEFYRSQDLLIEINGEASPPEVTAHILQALTGFAKLTVSDGAV